MSGTLVLVETCTAFTGQRSLIFCKVASAAGGHSLSAVSDSSVSALTGRHNCEVPAVVSKLVCVSPFSDTIGTHDIAHMVYSCLVNVYVNVYMTL